MPQTDPLTGTQVANRYRIIYRIGEGGMGVTYRAWDCQTARPVVLKCPKMEMLVVAGFVRRFEREARTLASLVHTNIVPITDLGMFDGLPYFVMPYLPGGSLANRRLRDRSGSVKPMLPSTLHLWLPQVALALDHVHSAGIVHRDIKPGNVFFDSGWHAYLGDFGIAKNLNDHEPLDAEQPLTALNVSIGTPEYMAPELFSPAAPIDGRVDQYALAVVAYEILAGRRPFVGNSLYHLVETTKQPPPPLSDLRDDLPPSLVRAIDRALAKRSADRFADCWTFVCTALADVPAATDEPDVARLLCPTSACNNNLKLPMSAAGRKGRCPRCNNQMVVAPDLSALWLVREETSDSTAPTAGPANAAPTPSPATPSFTTPTPATPSPITPSLPSLPSLPSPATRFAPVMNAAPVNAPPAPPPNVRLTWMRRLLQAAALLALLAIEAVVVSRLSTARVQLDHNRTIDTLRQSQEQVEKLEQVVRDLVARMKAMDRENALLRESAP